MSVQLPLPTMDFEIYLSTTEVHISVRPGLARLKYRRSLELGDANLAAAWVLADVLRTLEVTMSKQSEI